MSHWATPPLDRDQVTLFAPTLDDNIAADHPVRLFDELLCGIDFSDWESMYVRVVGQPPIHPRALAGAILYGLTLGVRSSRRLEDAAYNRLDFIWLLEGRKPDHATICGFRTRFGPQLKALFGKVGRVGIEMGLVTLNQVTLDGTTVRANNSRYNTARRAGLAEKLAALDEQVERLMNEAAEQDRAEDALYGPESSPAKLPRDLKDLKRRQERLKRAMKKLAEMEAARGARKDVSPKGPAVPLADPDSRVLPNKEGGYAPNYTPVLAVDAGSGIIVDAQVLGGNDEASTVLASVANIEEALGSKPAQLAADSGFNTGANLAGLQEQGVEPLMPARQGFEEFKGDKGGGDGQNPAVREDPSQPVADADRDRLPMNPQNKVLDKVSFVYDTSKDCYVCPMGKVLQYVEDKPYDRHGTKGTYKVYQCDAAACAACPLAARCLPKTKDGVAAAAARTAAGTAAGAAGVKQVTGRRLCRDEYEGHRERMAARMKTEAGKSQYKRRAHAAETPFAVFKAVMGMRQFLLRGLDKVTQELRWTATAYNLTKLVRHKAAALAAAATTAAAAVAMAAAAIAATSAAATATMASAAPRA